MRRQVFFFPIIVSLCGLALLCGTSLAADKSQKSDRKKCEEQAEKANDAKEGRVETEGKAKTAETNALPVEAQIQMLTQELSELPPNPKAGECYIRVRKEAKYETVTEKVLVKPASVRYEIVPAKFKDVDKRVLIRPESVRYEVIPAQFAKKEVTVELAPKHTALTATETKFKQEKSKIEIKPERVEWKRGSGLLNNDGGRANDKASNDILCLVREPAEFREYTKQVLASEAKVDTRQIKSREQKIETTVLVKAAEVKEIKVPAEYRTVKVRELVSPASKKEVGVPAEYMTVKRKVLVHPETLVWQRVLCNTNITPEVIRKVQAALKEKGFDPRTDKASWNRQTQQAVQKYQAKHKLARGGLTYEFLEHIGVQP